jgi:hypothetical protein
VKSVVKKLFSISFAARLLHVCSAFGRVSIGTFPDAFPPKTPFFAQKPANPTVPDFFNRAVSHMPAVQDTPQFHSRSKNTIFTYFRKKVRKEACRRHY